MKTLFTELKIKISNDVFKIVDEQAPKFVCKNINETPVHLHIDLFDKKLQDFLTTTNIKIQITSYPANWHTPWQKNKKTIIRTPIRLYEESIECFTDSTHTDKDTMFQNKFKTYNVPYIFSKPYVLTSEHFHTVVNYSNNLRHCLDIIVDMHYDNVLEYFAIRNLVEH